MPPTPAVRGVDRHEFDQAVADRDWDDMDGRWPLATHFLAFLSDLEDAEPASECVAASRATVDLVLEIMMVFAESNSEQFHSYAICRDRLAIIERSLDAYLAYNASAD